jgi:uncharacterized membrane protein
VVTLTGPAGVGKGSWGKISDMESLGVLGRAGLLGVATGMRSQLGLAALAWSGADGTRALRTLSSRSGRVSAAVAAAGELVADKLPNTPSRLKPQVLGARLASGALDGVLAAGKADLRTRALAGATGLAGAAAGSYAGAAYRKAAVTRTNTPDLPWALVEDAVAAGLAVAAVRTAPDPRPWWRRRLMFG